MTALLLGTWGLMYNQFILMEYYNVGKIYGFVELLSDRYLPILLQGYMIGIISVYLLLWLLERC